MKIWRHTEDDLDNPIGMHPPQIEGNVPADEGNVAYAIIIDEEVVEASIANPNYWNILKSNYTVEDVTSGYPEVDANESCVLKFFIEQEEILTVGVTKRFGAIMLSNPRIVEITIEDAEVMPGWRYENEIFVCPPDFDPYSDQHY